MTPFSGKLVGCPPRLQDESNSLAVLDAARLRSAPRRCGTASASAPVPTTRSSISSVGGRVSGVTLICGARAVSAALLTVTGMAAPVCGLGPPSLPEQDRRSARIACRDRRQSGMDARSRLHVRPAAGETVAVALVLHGGKARSMRPASRRQLSAVRMTPFARALASRRQPPPGSLSGPCSTAIAAGTTRVLRSRTRCGPSTAPPRSIPARRFTWSGHSLGRPGRHAAPAATRACGRSWRSHPGCRPASGIEHLRGVPVLIAHGTRDQWVDAAAAR